MKIYDESTNLNRPFAESLASMLQSRYMLVAALIATTNLLAFIAGRAASVLSNARQVLYRRFNEDAQSDDAGHRDWSDGNDGECTRDGNKK